MTATNSSAQCVDGGLWLLPAACGISLLMALIRPPTRGKLNVYGSRLVWFVFDVCYPVCYTYVNVVFCSVIPSTWHCGCIHNTAMPTHSHEPCAVSTTLATSGARLSLVGRRILTAADEVIACRALGPNNCSGTGFSIFPTVIQASVYSGHDSDTCMVPLLWPWLCGACTGAARRGRR